MSHLELLIESFKRKKVVIFAGAGVSMLEPSRAPSWWQIYESAAKALYSRMNEEFPEWDDSIPLSDLLGDISTQNLADLIVTEFAGESFIENLQVVDVADPNENHRLISALTTNNYVTAIFTSNFDTLIERASAHINQFFEISTPGIPKSGRSSLKPLIKIHGSSVEPSYMLETLSQKVRQHSEEFVDPWKSIFKGKDLLVLGYSGADISMGLAKVLFDVALKQTNSIFWLKRKGSKLNLIEPYNSEVQFIEDDLPDILRTICEHTNVEDYITPLSKRDAMKALDEKMEKWSRKISIGKWSAASFFLALAHRKNVFENENQKLLSIFLKEIAEEEVEKIEPGNSFNLKDTALYIFLQKVGQYQLRINELEMATKMFRGSINIMTAMDNALPGTYNEFKERKSNLAGSWSNFGLSLLLIEREKAISAYFKALEYGYLSGKDHSFLTPLQNIIHYVLTNIQIRRSLFWVEAALRIADRKGFIQLSIEFRHLAICLYLDRNEIWTAETILNEVQPMALANRDKNYLYTFNLLLALIYVRKGKVEKGLLLLQELVENNKKTVALHKGGEELRKLLTIMGVCEDIPFIFKFRFSSIKKCISEVNKEMEKAKQESKLPFNGQIFGTYSTSYVDKQDQSFLFSLGRWTFVEDYDSLVNFSIGQALHHINHSRFQDAIWNLTNVTSIPIGIVNVRNLGLAYNLLGSAYNCVTRIEKGLSAFKKAISLFKRAGEQLPVELIENCFWHHMQCRDWDKATEWLVVMLDQLTGEDDMLFEFTEKVKSWNTQAPKVIKRMYELVDFAGDNITVQNSVNPYMHFYFSGHVLGENENSTYGTIFQRIQSLMNQNKIDEGLKLIKELIEKPGVEFSDLEFGRIIAFQIVGMTRNAEKLDGSFIDRFRHKALLKLNFSALSLVEYSWMQITDFKSVPKKEALLFRDRSFITELSMDPSSSLFYLGMAFRNLNQSELNSLSHFEKSQMLLLDFYSFFESFGITKTRKHKTTQSFDLKIFNNETINAIERSHTENEAIKIAAQSCIVLRKEKLLDFKTIILIRGYIANWLLKKEEFDRAIHHYKVVRRLSKYSSDSMTLWNSMAGEARSHSRSGNYDEAVLVFEEAILLAKDTAFQTNLLLGLASAHLLESKRVDNGSFLRKKSIEIFRVATSTSSFGDISRTLARFGLAKALGEDGQQEIAMQEFDMAVAEFTHLGQPVSKVLLENRDHFKSGDWSSIQLI